MLLNKEVIEKNLDYIRETTKTNRNEFLIAFFLYEINETKKEELTEDMINSIYHILEESEYYYDEELLINHLLAIPGVINCSRENINTTMNVFLPNITTFRLFLNGTIEYLYDNHLIEYRLKGGYYD